MIDLSFYKQLEQKSLSKQFAKMGTVDNTDVDVDVDLSQMLQDDITSLQLANTLNDQNTQKKSDCNKSNETLNLVQNEAAINRETDEVESVEKAVQERKDTNMENPKVMDVELVMQMFGDLKNEFAELKRDATKNNVKVSDVEALNTEICGLKQKNILLTGVVGRLGTVCMDLEKRLEKIENNNVKRAIVFNGIQTDDNMSKCAEQIMDFISNDLKIEEGITMVDCFKLGRGPNKPVVINVATMDQKMLIFQEMDKYRESYKRQKRNCKIYANSYQLPELREKIRQERDIMKENSSDESTKIDMELGRTGLIVQGQPFTNPVKPPHSTEILKCNREEISEIFKVALGKGERSVYEGSLFQGYVVPVNSIGMIKKAYMKLRLIHPQAQHLICAYTIPGLPRCFHEGFCDDKETGAGRILMNMIKDNNLSNLALFVVRTQTGSKIGPIRFELIEKAAANAVGNHPINIYTNENMVIQPKQPKTVTKRDSNHGGAKYAKGYLQQNGRGRYHPRSPSTRSEATSNEQTKRRRQRSPETHVENEDLFSFAPPKEFRIRIQQSTC